MSDVLVFLPNLVDPVKETFRGICFGDLHDEQANERRERCAGVPHAEATSAERIDWNHMYTLFLDVLAAICRRRSAPTLCGRVHSELQNRPHAAFVFCFLKRALVFVVVKVEVGRRERRSNGASDLARSAAHVVTTSGDIKQLVQTLDSLITIKPEHRQPPRRRGQWQGQSCVPRRCANRLVGGGSKEYAFHSCRVLRPGSRLAPEGVDGGRVQDVLPTAFCLQILARRITEIVGDDGHEASQF